MDKTGKWRNTNFGLIWLYVILRAKILVTLPILITNFGLIKACLILKTKLSITIWFSD